MDASDRASELYEIRIKQLFRQVIVNKPGHLAHDRIDFDLHSLIDENLDLLPYALVDVRLARMLDQEARGLVVGIGEANRVSTRVYFTPLP